MSVSIQPTPNPNALKFITPDDVKAAGKSSYKTSLECKHNPMAIELFKIRGIDQVHFYKNSITVSKFGYIEWSQIEDEIVKTIEDQLPQHDPQYVDPNPEEERRARLSPELKEIEGIIDRTIRPGLQGDGGDIACLSYEDNILVVQYQGACGTCPSSTTGTLEAIKGILKDQYNPEIEVYIAPSF